MITTAPNSFVRHLRVPGYLILFIAMILPLLDLLVSVMPLRPTTVVWRFGAVGLFSSAIGAPLLILFFIYVLSVLAGDRKITMLVGIVSALICLSLVLGSGAFVLDALQMKQRVQPAAQTRFMTASVQAMLKLGMQGLGSLVLAISAFRALKAARAAPVARGTEPRAASSLLVGRSASRPVVAEVVESTPRPVDE